MPHICCNGTSNALMDSSLSMNVQCVCKREERVQTIHFVILCLKKCLSFKDTPPFRWRPLLIIEHARGSQGMNE